MGSEFWAVIGVMILTWWVVVMALGTGYAFAALIHWLFDNF